MNCLEDIGMTKNQQDVFYNVLNERIKQEVKWGIQKHSVLKWLSILTEEVGEIAQNCNEQTPANGMSMYSNEALEENLIYELEQVMAVSLAWLEYIKGGAGRFDKNL